MRESPTITKSSTKEDPTDCVCDSASASASSTNTSRHKSQHWITAWESNGNVREEAEYNLAGAGTDNDVGNDEDMK